MLVHLTMTSSIIYKSDETLKELQKFSDDLLDLGETITDSRLDEFEAKIGYKLPLDFRYILIKHNSFSLAGTQVYGLDKSFRGTSLDKVYQFEHEEVEDPMFKEFLPFSPDGRGNHYCFDLSKLENDICPVVFWQHDYHYSDKDDVETCNNSFIEWVNEVVIAWALEEMNYDGTEKQ
jgi:cell wall assembly regulator SMI1